MKKERKVWAMTMIAFWLLASNQTKAQQDSLRTLNLNEVVVTATKFPKSIAETGKVVNVIDELQLQRSAGKDLSQLLNEQVGLVVNGAVSNPGKDKSVFLRGAKGDYTLILIDGVPLSDPSGIGGAFDLRLIPIDQVERIEILKGSQSTLYGSDAIAGVINIITKKSGDKPFNGFGTVSYGSYNTFKGNAGVSGSTRLWDYDLTYMRFQSDGISEAYDETGSGNFDKDGFNQDAFQLNLGFKPTEDISIRPFVRYSDFGGDYDAGSFADDPDAVYEASLLNYGLNGQYTFAKGAVNVLYAHDKTERDYITPFSSFPNKGHYDHGEVFSNYSFGKHIQLLAGLSYQRMEMNLPEASIKYRSLNITNPYVSFFINDISRFSIELGAREVIHSVYGHTFTYSINPTYKIGSVAKLFVNYSTGFKAPTLSQLYGQFGANEELNPEESRSIEGGVHLFTKDKKANVRATLFSRKVDNVIIYTAGEMRDRYLNLDQQDDYGFEVEPVVQINENLNIGAFYSYVTGELTTPLATGGDTTYNNLIRRPKHSFGINATYAITKQLTVSMNFKTFGKRDDLFFNMNTFTQERVGLNSYQLLNLYAEYRLLAQRLKLFVDAKNILDQDYTEVYGYSTQGFNVQTGLSFNF
ncbi:TonB-dependent receptor plug domain-containing protein [Chryseosolibacter indicus]|uniref:TonB-dependent receptor n=1 Tax=Chryseosolibacter indicus TaxID=2782351 RepID=A0ABS5VXE0_9BACT|nr:TonB-dependent receptor [Chryseosolibacter indicus]MBT1706090.1 TonB-dependent receptor [Chryseosolibacter indicus]